MFQFVPWIMGAMKGLGAMGGGGAAAGGASNMGGMLGGLPGLNPLGQGQSQQGGGGGDPLFDKSSLLNGFGLFG